MIDSEVASGITAFISDENEILLVPLTVRTTKMDRSQIKCGELLFSVHCLKEARRLMDHRSYTRNLSCEIKTRKKLRVEVHSYP